VVIDKAAIRRLRSSPKIDPVARPSRPELIQPVMEMFTKRRLNGRSRWTFRNSRACRIDGVINDAVLGWPEDEVALR